MSYAASDEALREGMDRLVRFVRRVGAEAQAPRLEKVTP
jgi:hypothetical protein